MFRWLPHFYCTKWFNCRQGLCTVSTEGCIKTIVEWKLSRTDIDAVDFDRSIELERSAWSLLHFRTNQIAVRNWVLRILRCVLRMGSQLFLSVWVRINIPRILRITLQMIYGRESWGLILEFFAPVLDYSHSAWPLAHELNHHEPFTIWGYVVMRGSSFHPGIRKHLRISGEKNIHFPTLRTKYQSAVLWNTWEKPMLSNKFRVAAPMPPSPSMRIIL